MSTFYYVAREVPSPITDVYQEVAQTWDVARIITTQEWMHGDVLYVHKTAEILYYIEDTDKETYDMLDAFGILHLSMENYEKVPDQVVYLANNRVKFIVTSSRDGQRHVVKFLQDGVRQS
jgi:hypothetical protein